MDNLWISKLHQCLFPGKGRGRCEYVTGVQRILWRLVFVPTPVGIHASQPVHLPAFLLRGAARTPVSMEEGWEVNLRSFGSVIDVALLGKGSARTLENQLRHFENAVLTFDSQPHLIPNLDLLAGLGGLTIDPDVAGLGRGGGKCACL